ncbi:MAG: OmpA family protein [Treponema sp.]|nr:OmpA family protein [Treponema sp.]
MKKLAVIFGFFLFSEVSFSQTRIAYSGDSSYKLVERTNLRHYVNGKYSGLTSREVRSFISLGDNPSGTRSPKSDRWYDGNFYVLEETLRNSKSTLAGINEAIPSVFKISADGKMTMIEDNGYPTFRSFPSYTTGQLKKGDSWKGEGERAVDPMNKGVFTRIPILVLYTFEGAEIYKGENVFRIKAIWQTNYGFSNFDRDPKGDDTLKKATGGHKADIIVRASTGEAILISDNVDETFAYADGTQVNLKGTITLFTEYPPAIDHDKLIFALNRIAKADTTPKAGKPQKETASSTGAGTSGKSGKSGIASTVNTPASPADSSTPAVASAKSSSSADKNNMIFEETPKGLRLSVRDIKFKADSSEVLLSEKSRLDEIAEVLKLAPDSQFLIEGHTASVGKPSGEQKLSEERAKNIATELSKRGISAEKFICKGYGGTKPVAPNSTDEGRAQNRRVEITILE